MSTTVETRYTAEDLLAMPDEGRYELVNGQLVERSVGAESDFLGVVIISLLWDYVRSGKKGLVFGPKTGYQIFKDDPDHVRYPDTSYVRSGRLPGDKPPKGHVRIPPDLAVEVISPNDTAEEIEAKVVKYLGAGVPLIWVLYPESKTVYVYRKDRPPSHLTVNDELSGEDILPGFTCRVADLFAGI